MHNMMNLVLAVLLAVAPAAAQPPVKRAGSNRVRSCQIAFLTDPSTNDYVAYLFVEYVGAPRAGIPVYTFEPWLPGPGDEIPSWGLMAENPFHIWIGPVAEGEYRVTATVPCGATASAVVRLRGDVPPQEEVSR